jgi:hypothetical protein
MDPEKSTRDSLLRKRESLRDAVKTRVVSILVAAITWRYFITMTERTRLLASRYVVNATT